MTAKIKLNAASGGGSFSLQAPSSSANTRVMTLPDTADGTVLTTTNPRSGNTVQTVQTTTYTRIATTSTTYVATAHTVTITPIFASSKILIDFHSMINTNGTDHRAFVDVYRSINGGTFTGIAPVGSNQTVGANNNSGFLAEVRGDNSRIQVPFAIHYLDSPSYSVGNTIEYKLYIRSHSASNTVELPCSSDAEPVVNMLTEIAQ